jgi:FixJ family two-component response regulator
LTDVARCSPLEKIETLTVRLADLEADRERAVAQAMAAGASWAQIATALGISTQAAHKRYRWLRHSPATGECWYEPPLDGLRRPTPA